jgi:xylulokinase
MGKKELFREWADSRDAFQLMAQEIEQNAPKPSGVIFIPHLRGRNFPTQPWLRGVFAGFSWDHRRENLYRAILEGIAFEYAFYLKVIRELIPNLTFKEVRVIGGGAKSPLWNRIKASILKVPYVELNRQEYAVWGAALIAGHAVGVFQDLQKTSLNSVEKKKVHYPDEKLSKVYEKFIPYYLETMDKMNEVFEKYRELL